MTSFTRTGLLTIAVALAAAGPAVGQVTITSFNPGTVPTLGSLTVNGAGFDPANGAISIVIAPRGGLTTTVPAYYADAGSLKIVVPPLVENATGELFSVPVVADL